MSFIITDNYVYHFIDLNLFCWDVRTHFVLWSGSYVLSSVTCHFNLNRSCHVADQWIIVWIWYWIWLQIFFSIFLILNLYIVQVVESEYHMINFFFLIFLILNLYIVHAVGSEKNLINFCDTLWNLSVCSSVFYFVRDLFAVVVVVVEY